MKTILPALRVLVALTVLTGVLYPLAVWAVGQTFFRAAAEGSLINRNGKVIGSVLIAQKTTDPRYFWPRPSAGDYATVASAASNQAWTNTKLRAVLEERRAAFGGGAVPADLLTASGSGLDPDLTPEAIRIQIARVAEVRRLDGAQRKRLEKLITESIEGGNFSPARINVLRLNLATDDAFPRS